MPTSHREGIIQTVVAAAIDLQGIVAMTLGGSTQTGLADEASDLDIHVYWREPLAKPGNRAAHLKRCADPGSIRVEVRSWGLEDAFRIEGCTVELIYVNLAELESHVEQAYGEGLQGEGFTTALLHTVANGRPLYDPTEALQALQARLNASFPEATRRLLLQRHPPLIRAYLKQLGLAQERGDLLSVQHRRYTLQMVFFNLLFTLNRCYHPGEKRLLVHAEQCRIRPTDCVGRWTRVASLSAADRELFLRLEALTGDLYRLIEEHGGVEIAGEPW